MKYSIDTNKYKCNNILINNRRRGINPMKTIYLIIHHYFDEAKQQKANNIHSTYNSYHEALGQVRMFEQLGWHEGWFEIKEVDYYINNHIK